MLNRAAIVCTIYFLTLICGQYFIHSVESVKPIHAIAMHGQPKYKADFSHFDYVNPKASKGGMLRWAREGTFDSFHTLIAKGTPTSTDSIESLLQASQDEPFTSYGLLAESLEVPEDRSWVIFNLRPEARWHDGRPITADDVVWSFEILTTKGLPHFRYYYADVKECKKLGERRVQFIFSQTGNRELPLIMGQLPILPKHYWENKDFEKSTLTPPLGSGPYRIKRFDAGRHIIYERVPDYWGANLPINRGQNNFDLIRTDFYRDGTAIRLALKSGEIDFNIETSAKSWALDYDIPAVQDGLLKKESIPNENPSGLFGFVMNTRRGVFLDRKVRRALAYAFDFEWTNKLLFFNEYHRTESYFSNSELAATGLPQGQELAILEKYRDRLPPEVFNKAYRTPRTDGKGWPRENLKRAFELLQEAGWEVRNMKLVHRETGKAMAFEILILSASFERIILPFVRNLNRLGIDARLRLVDRSQYVNRLRQQDFDMIMSGWRQSNSPGNEQRNFWSSQSADQANSRNYPGIKSPIVDELIEMLIQAPDRESLVARTKALDRVLLWGHYVIPGWHLQSERILYWDKFSKPEKTAKNGVDIRHWWYDAQKDRQLSLQRKQTLPSSGVKEQSLGTLGSVMAFIGLFVVVGMFIYFFWLQGRRRGSVQ